MTNKLLLLMLENAYLRGYITGSGTTEEGIDPEFTQFPTYLAVSGLDDFLYDEEPEPELELVDRIRHAVNAVPRAPISTSAESAQVVPEAENITLPSYVRPIDEPTPVPVAVPIPHEEHHVVDEEPEPSPRKGGKTLKQQAEEKYPWPPWKSMILTPEQEYNKTLLDGKKRLSGPILEVEDDKLLKLCSGCLTFKDAETDFGKSKSHRDGRSALCRACSVYSSGVYNRRAKFIAGEDEPKRTLHANTRAKKAKSDTPTRNCNICHIWKPLTKQFFQPVKFSDGSKDFAAYCLECGEKQSKKALQGVIQENQVAV